VNKMCKMFALSLGQELNVASLVASFIGRYAPTNPDGFGYAWLNAFNPNIQYFKNENNGMDWLMRMNSVKDTSTDALYAFALIGHTRLATSTVCYENTHPFMSEDGKIALCHNGVIHDTEQVRKKLESEGHIFSSRGVDSEVLLHLFEKHGKYCVEKLINDYNASGSLNVLALRSDGTIVGISDGSLYLTKISEGFVLSSTSIADESVEIPSGVAVTLKDGRLVDRRRVFNKTNSNYYYNSSSHPEGQNHLKNKEESEEDDEEEDDDDDN
jgi:glutamine phosphoribosylpyrophosphate amidotransferase